MSNEQKFEQNFEIWGAIYNSVKRGAVEVDRLVVKGKICIRSLLLITNQEKGGCN